MQISLSIDVNREQPVFRFSGSFFFCNIAGPVLF